MNRESEPQLAMSCEVTIVDDHPLYRVALKGAVSAACSEVTFHEADSVASRFDTLEYHPNAGLPLLDLNLPDAAHLQNAVASDANAGRLITVADTGGSTKSKRRKAPALYTEDQATSGALAYYQNCAMCHGPALKGPEFADPSYHFHVSDIFNFAAKLMPAATPGSLTHNQDVLIMAQNGYPAGSKELVYEDAEKSTVPPKYYGK
jgi:mono/diheme cytochrome c family protein